MKSEILYFEKPGKQNTVATLEAAQKRAAELGIRQVVVATTHGYTGLTTARVFGREFSIVGVTISHAFAEEGWTVKQAEREAMEQAGIKVLTSMHALGDDVNDGVGSISAARVVRDTLYRFCQGMKVAVEVTLMAADAGLIDTEKEAVAIAGSSEGADTAIVVKPSYTRLFKSFEIREIIAKPRQA